MFTLSKLYALLANLIGLVILTSVLAAEAPPATTSQPAGLRVRLQFDGKPLRGCVFVQTKTSAVRYFCPEEGALIPNIVGPCDLTYVAPQVETKAYAGEAHSDQPTGEIVITVKEIPWKTINITVQDENKKPITDRRLKLVSLIKDQVAWEHDLKTDDQGKAASKCVDGITYYLVCGRPEKAGSVGSKRFTTADLKEGQVFFEVPTLPSVSFAFRFVKKTPAGFEHLNISACEVVRAGVQKPIDNVFYLWPGAPMTAALFTPGATLEIRLPDDVARNWKFADGKGVLTLGKLGERTDIELIPTHP